MAMNLQKNLIDPVDQVLRPMRASQTRVAARPAPEERALVTGEDCLVNHVHPKG
jgi:hypothetical protein